VAALEIADDRIAGVRLQSGEAVPRDIVVVAPRFVARADLLAGLGVETAEMENVGPSLGRFVPADPSVATGVPGVWVAGNVADLGATVIGAAAAGQKAGAALNVDLAREDAARAVAARREVNDAVGSLAVPAGAGQ
jgi:thioredoxin reductase